MHLETNVFLSDYTTLHIGGAAENFVAITNNDELREAILWAKQEAQPITILGGGSNVLVSDEGVRGLVIKNDIGGVTFSESDNDATVHAGAGVVFDALVETSVTKNYWGLENLSGIPGSVGATPIQNVGAYGIEVMNVIQSVEVYDMATDTFQILAPSLCKFSYRDSLFKHTEGRRYVVTAVTYRLSREPHPQLGYADLQKWFKGKTPTVMEVRDAVLAIRGTKFPDWHTTGTAGSFFKNPIITEQKYTELQNTYPALPGFMMENGCVKIPLGWILDKVLHLKGVTEGSVGTHDAQALVVVNHGGATAAEVTAFAENICDRVKKMCSVTIEWEVTSLPYER